MSTAGTKEIIMRNIFSNWAYYFFSVILGFFMMPFMVHRLGSTIYGFWILILSLTGYMGLFDLGMRGSAIKFVSELKIKKQYGELNRVVNTIYTVQNIIGILVFILSIVIATYFEKFIFVDNKYIGDIKITIILVGLNIAINFFGGAVSGVLEACKRVDIISFIEIASLVLQTILTIISVITGHGIVALGVILLLINTIRQSSRFLYAHINLPQLRLSIGLIDIAILRKIFGYGMYIFIMSLSSKIIFRTDNIVIGIILGASAITSYNVGLQLVNYYSTLHFYSTTVLLPFASEYNASEDKTKLRKLFLTGTKYSYLLTGLIASIFIVGGKRLISLWMGPDFVSNYSILLILLIPYIFLPSYFVMSPILKGIGQLRFYTTMTIFESAANILLSIFLAKKIGIIGVALGTAIPFLIIRGFILIPYVMRMVGVRSMEYFKKSLMPAFIPTTILIISLMLLTRYATTNHLLVYISELGVGMIIYVIICFYTSFNEDERIYYYERLQSILAWMPHRRFVETKTFEAILEKKHHD